MKKPNSLFMGLIVLALLSSSYSCSKRADDGGYPLNPTNGQVYRDSNGNTSTWNALLGYWMISSMMNGRQTTHYYYPGRNEYRDERNAVVSRPTYIPAYRTASPTRSSMFGKSSTSTTGKSGGFGSTGRSSSSATSAS